MSVPTMEKKPDVEFNNSGYGGDSVTCFRRICVFCGSSPGKKASYEEAAIDLRMEPVGLLNVDGCYNSLLSFIDMAVSEEFISQTARSTIVSPQTAKDFVRKIEEYVPEQDEFVFKLCWKAVEKEHKRSFASELEPS